MNNIKSETAVFLTMPILLQLPKSEKRKQNIDFSKISLDVILVFIKNI